MPPVNKAESQTIFTEAPPKLFRTDAMGNMDGLAKGLAASAELLEDREKVVDEAAAMQAYAEASRLKQDLMYDASNGIFTKKGANAVGEEGRFDQETNRIGQDLGRGLTANQQKKFNQMWQRSNLSDRESVKRHGMTEAIGYRQDAAKAVVGTSIDAAANAYNDEETLKRAKSEIAGATLAEMNGQSPQAVKLAVAERFSALHKQVLLRKIEENPFLAQKYYEQHKDEILGSDHTQIANALKPAIMAARVQAETEKIVKGSGPLELLGEAMGETEKRKVARSRVQASEGQSQELVDALVTQESGGRTNIETHNYYPGTRTIDPERTAVGVMQVTVRTARDISREIGDSMMEGKSSSEVKELLKDPQINARYGLHYLHKYIRKYDGDIEAALVQYNSGQADKWLRNGRDYSSLAGQGTVGTKKVNFRQTENYVKNVMAMYARNLKGEGKYPRTQATLTRFEGMPEELDPGEVHARLKSNYKGTDFETFSGSITPELRDGIAIMLTEAPPEVAKAVKIDGRLGTEGGISVQMDVKSSFAKAWVAANAARYGLNVPVAEPNKLEAVPHESQETVFNVEQTSGEAEASPEAPETIPTLHEEHNLEVWIKKAEAIQDPILRDKVLGELNQRFGLYEKARQQDEHKFKVAAWQLALEGKPIPPQIMAGITPEYASSIRSYLNSKAKGQEIETDWPVWWSVMSKTPEELMKVDPFTYRAKLNDKEFNKLLDMVKDARGIPSPGKEGVSADTRSSRQMIEDTTKSLSLNDEGKAKLARAFDARQTRFVQENKKKPDPIQQQEILDQLVKERDSGWFGKNVRVFEITPGQKFGTELFVQTQDEVPVADRAQIMTRYRQVFKREVSQTEMLQMYTAHIVGQQGGLVAVPDSFKPHLEKYAKARNLPVSEEALSAYYMDWIKKVMD